MSQDTVLTCPVCGAPWPSQDAAACSYCGYSKTESRPRTCSHCGAALRPELERCEYCKTPVAPDLVGAALRDPTPNPAPAPSTSSHAPERSSFSVANIILPGVLVAVAFAIVSAMASTFTDPTVSGKLQEAAGQASTILGIVLFVAMAAVVLKLTDKL